MKNAITKLWTLIRHDPREERRVRDELIASMKENSETLQRILRRLG